MTNREAERIVLLVLSKVIEQDVFGAHLQEGNFPPADHPALLAAAEMVRGVLARAARRRESPRLCFKTDDCPDAHGRSPADGEHRWTFTFKLDSGKTLLLQAGAVCRNAMRDLLLQEDAEDAAAAP